MNIKINWKAQQLDILHLYNQEECSGFLALNEIF